MMSVDAAREALEADIRAREEKCAKELHELLDRCGCTLDVAVSLRPGRSPEFTFKVVTK